MNAQRFHEIRSGIQRIGCLDPLKLKVLFRDYDELREYCSASLEVHKAEREGKPFPLVTAEPRPAPVPSRGRVR